ncbi:uncharacterized protein TRIADDRAFT_15905, partial [Trichoplax adhaerens]
AIVKAIVFITTFIFSITGNLIIGYVVIRTRRLWTFTNIMMLNYSFVTILFLISGLFQFISDFLFHGTWPFGSFLCQILYSSFIFTTIVSALTITLMCYARYRAICKSLYVQPNKKQAIYCIGVIWLMAIGYMIPYGMSLKTKTFGKSSYCIVINSSLQSYPNRLIYDACLFALTFVAPVLTVAFFNIQVIRDLAMSPGRQLPEKVFSASDDLQFLQHDQSIDSIKEKLRKMSVIIFVVYLLAWLPFWIYIFLVDTNVMLDLIAIYSKYDCDFRQKILIIRTFTKYLTYFYSISNVIICYYCNPHFNSAFKSIFCC